MESEKLSSEINNKLHQVFKKVALKKEFSKVNVFICHLCITLALAMLTQGLDGDSRAENIKGLGFDPQEILPTTFLDSLEQISSQQGVTLNMANSLWSSLSCPIQKDFRDEIQGKYKAEIQSVDFSDETTTERVNQWVNEKTNQMIPKLLNQNLDKDSILVLLNAVYFKGLWANKFEEK